MIDLEKIIAVRSLMCEDHAHNIEPTVLFISWMLGKRCNYDCSYCSPHSHDAVSPFLDQAVAENFVRRMFLFAKANNKRIKWGFTGGEPFIDPSFVSLVKLISQHSTTEQINVVTNGSLPLDVYTSLKDDLAGITVSLHLERSAAETDATVKKIIELASSTDMFINVNLMFLPGREQQIKSIIETFRKNNVKFVLRKIMKPDLDTGNSRPYHTLSDNKKDKILFPIVEQSKLKQSWKKHNNSQLDQSNQNFYNEQELELIKQTNEKISWNNLGVWYTNDQYCETNTDQLISSTQYPSFENWICFAGVDQLYVDFDGSVYTGLCLNGGSIGHISDQDCGFRSQPQQCETQYCICNTDMAVRKSKKGHELLITSEKQS